MMGMCRIALATGQLAEAHTLIIEAMTYNVMDDEISVAARAKLLFGASFDLATACTGPEPQREAALDRVRLRTPERRASSMSAPS